MVVPTWKEEEPHEYYEPDSDPQIPDPHDSKTVPALLTRLLIKHYTHNAYGENLLKNLAPGLDSVPADLPAEIQQLLRWRNGYVDEEDYLEILPGQYRLLSLEEALAFSESININEEADPGWWNSDIYPVFLQPDLQTCIVVSKSTGRAGYRSNSSTLTDEEDMGWFPSLYQLLRKMEVAIEENRIAYAKGSGRPMEGPIPGEARKEAVFLTDRDEE